MVRDGLVIDSPALSCPRQHRAKAYFMGADDTLRTALAALNATTFKPPYWKGIILNAGL